MVKAELTIKFTEKGLLNLSLDLLKREDATDAEFHIAESIQESLLSIIDALQKDGFVKELGRKIIK